MLIKYADQHYAQPLSADHCEAFIQECNTRIAQDNNSEDCQDAVWLLLEHMHLANLPQPSVSTFILATHSVLQGLHRSDAIPSYHALVMLQQHVWERAHNVFGDSAVVAAVYAPVFEQFEALSAATETVQTMLLMSQNGVAGVDADSCLAIDCNFDDEQLVWATETFGTDFITQVKAVASRLDQAAGIAVRFPKHELPCLCVVQLRNGLAVFEVQQGFTPLWMRPSAYWDDPNHVHELKMREQNVTDTNSNITKLSAAEKLQLEFGYVDKVSKRRSRK